MRTILVLLISVCTITHLYSQNNIKSYDELIVGVEKTYEEAVRKFYFTSLSKEKIKLKSIENFKNKFPKESFNKNIKINDEVFISSMKDAVLYYNDPKKFSWYLEKESELYKSILIEGQKMGFEGNKVNDWCDCLVSKFMANYPNADYNPNDNKVIRDIYLIGKDCTLETKITLNDINNSPIAWNDITRSGITKSLLADYEKGLSGIYSFNQILSLVQYQVGELEKKYPNGLKPLDIKSDEVSDYLIETHKKWKNLNNIN